MALRVRAFAPDDFDQAVLVMPPEWNPQGCTPEEAQAQNRMDLASCLMRSPWRLVAVEGEGASEQVVGILLARPEGLAPSDAEHWKALYEDACSVLENGSVAAQEALAYERQLGDVQTALRAAAGEGLGEDNEAILFATLPARRGSGAGSALMAAFEQHLSARGATSCWLETDDDCTWSWYERHGYVRVAEIDQPPLALPADASEELAERAAARPASHAYIYRKDLAGASPANAAASPRPRFRPYDHDRDFEALIDLVPEDWSYGATSEEVYRQVIALMLAHMLERCTFLIVAEDRQGAGLLGVALGRLGMPTEQEAQPYRELVARLEAQLRETPEGTESLAQLDAELACDDALERAATPHLADDAEYVLFVTSSAARGKGVGASMITRFEDYLQANGARSYWLFTDTGCTYDWYDRHGFKRVAMTVEDCSAPEGYRVAAGEDLRGEPVPGEAHFVYRYDIG